MIRRLSISLCVVALMGLVALPAFAAVQNVKLSGDLNVKAISRNQFDLNRGVKASRIDDAESLFTSQTRVRVDADLTDNVGTTVRLINERNWNAETAANTDIQLDLAYVTLKEFLYSPLTVTVGRQELRYGNALIIGSANTYALGGAGVGVIAGVPTDLTLRKAFDAVKASLNYEPLIVDVIYAKMTENQPTGATKVNDDVNLYGINASYDIGRKDAKIDVYYFNKKDSVNNANPASIARDNVHTIGALLSAAPVENMKASLEIAGQLGKSTTNNTDKKLRAYAGQVITSYSFADKKYTPAIGASYTYLSGDTKSGDDKDNAWDPMYYDQVTSGIGYAILGFTDYRVVTVNGNMKPREDLTLALNYAGYFLNRNTWAGNAIASNKVDSNGNAYLYTLSGDKKFLGSGIDLTGTYDYTEDVQLGLTWGYFVPGKAFAPNNRREAAQVIGSMKVTF